jgi:hypothetical protein
MSKLRERKTFSVEGMIEYANGYLASDYGSGDSIEAQARRQGVIDLLESVLAFSQRYRGFHYLDERAITKSKPGIRWLEDGHYSFDNTDPTRRRYA